MSKKSKIRWRKSDEENLKKSIRNFNAKITRLEKKGIESNALPAKLNLKKVKNKIYDRKDFNSTLKDLRDFSANPVKIVQNARGEKSTDWEIARAKRLVDEINKLSKKNIEKINNMPIKAKGVSINAKRMNELQKAKPITFDFEKAGKGNFKKFVTAMEYKINFEKSGEYKKNFMENIIKGWYNTLSSTQANELEILAKRLGGEKIYDLYISGNNEISPSFTYEPISNDGKYKEIKEILEKEL